MPDEPERPAELQVVSRSSLTVTGSRTSEVVGVDVADRGPGRPERAGGVEPDGERDQAEALPGGPCRIRPGAHRPESTNRGPMSTLLAFVAVAALVIVTPGQDTALTIRNTLTGGRRTGIATALGVSSGQAVWALATSLGLAAVLVASEHVFLGLKLLGAAYLVYLGVHSLWRALLGRRAGGPLTGKPLARGAAFRQGLVSNLGNPKMAVFFTSLLPQFASGDTAFLDLLGLGLLFSAMTALWLAGYALAVDRASALLRRPLVRRVLDAVTGVVLVALGLRLASERR